MKQRWQIDIIILLALFVIPLMLFAPVTLGGKTILPIDNLYRYEPWASEREAAGVPKVPHNELLSDLILQNYQWKWFINENLREGEIPLWQPNQFAGTTFLANGQHSMLYPFSILYYVLPLSAAFGWFTVVQLWLAGIWMYAYVRGIGLGIAAGTIAALTVQLSSFFVVALVHPMIQAGAAWLPLLLLMIEYTIRQQPFPLTAKKPSVIPWVIIGASALGMVHLAGHLEILYYTLLVMAFYAAARLIFEWWHTGSFRTAFQRGLMLLSLVGLGFGIGSVQFMTGVEAANNSFRTERDTNFETVRGFALPERHVAAFVVPDIFGNPSHHSYYDVFEGETIRIRDERLANSNDDPRFVKQDTAFGIKNHVEGGAYMGILPLVLAAMGLLGGLQHWRTSQRINAPPLRLIFGTLAIITILLMFGTPFYATLYYGLPGVNQLHTPFRWIWPFTICVAIFAAFGMQYLVENRFPKATMRFGMLLTLSGAGLLGLLALSFILFDTIGMIQSVFERLYTSFEASRVFVDVEGFYSYTLRNLAFFALLILLAGLVLLLRRVPRTFGRGKWRAPVWLLAAVALIIFDLFVIHWSFYPRSEPEWLAIDPPSAVWLQERMDEEIAPFRIQALDFGEIPFHANAGWQYGLHDVRGYDSLFSIDYANMMGRIAPQGGLDGNRIDPITFANPQDIDSYILDLLNVRYLVTDWVIPPELDATALGYEEVYADTGLRIYENREALPRAYTVPQPTTGDTYTFGEGCVQEWPTLENIEHLSLFPPPSGTCINAIPATITQYNDIEIRVDAVVDKASWLVLADSYDSGWRTYVKPKGASDDEEREISLSQVNYNLRGVQLEAGEWTVRFRYSPPSFQIGAFLSFISSMLVIFLAVIWLWNTFVGTNADDDEGRRLIKNSLAPIILNLFNRAIDFAFAFIMLRILGPEDAGIYYYAIVIFGWFDIVTNFGLNTLLTREVARQPAAAGRYLFNTSILRIGLALLGVPLLLFVLFVRNTTVEPMLDDSAIIAILLLYVGLIPNSISTGLTALFYAFEKAEYPAAMTTVSTLFKVTLGLAALLLGGGVVGLAAASIATNFITFILLSRLAWPVIRSSWEPSPDRQFQRAMLREAWPLMINHLLATVFFRSDIVLMEAINGVAVVGVYSTAYKWLDALNIIPAFFTMALLPIMSRQAHEDIDGLKQNYFLGLKLLLFTALPVAATTTFLAYILVGILGGPEFLPDGAIALQFMIWSIPIGWMNSLTQYVLIALDRQRRITWAFIIAVGFNVTANLIFLPVYSFRAAAVTTIVSEIVLMCAFFWLLRDITATVNWFGFLSRPASATIVMVAVIWLLWAQVPLLALVVGVVTYAVILGMTRPFTTDELARLIKLVPLRLRHYIPQQRLLSDNF